MGRPKSLAAKQIERRLSSIRKIADVTQVRSGWIHYIRKALGMTQKNLAHAANLSVPTIAHMERREPEGRVTIETLRKLAAAMDCDLIYAIVPRKPVNEILRQQALAKATEILRAADIQMQLEDQKVKESFKARVSALADQLVADGDVW
jgi:predicted DNA-binding mobile mystery protein A